MADSTTSKLNLSTESIQVAAEDAREVQITNQAAAEDGSRFMDPKLYVAAADGDIHVLEQYDIHVQTPQKNTVLHAAAQFGQADCVEKILQLSYPSSLLQQPNEKGDTPLHLAAREGHLTVVKNLIDAAKQPKGDVEGGSTEVCKVMLRLTNRGKDTALHEAVRHHHPKVVKLLIQEDPEFTYGANTEGNTPLYIAAEWGFRDLVHMILDNCSSPAHDGFNGRTTLHAAVILNDEAMTKKILEWKPALIKELDQNGWSPLHFAAYVGCNPTIVTQLLDKYNEYQYVVYLGVKYKEIGNRTALHIAASRGHVDIVKLLVSRFPDCCQKVDDKGNNVLHLIMPKTKIFLYSGLSNIQWLRGLEHQKNVEGKTPLHLFHNSCLSIMPLTTMLVLKFDNHLRSRFQIRSRISRVSIRPLGSLQIKEDSDSSIRKESKEIYELKETMKDHMTMATLIATVTFAAGFTLPGGYIQDKSNDQGMAVLSLPTNGTKGTDGDMANAVRADFKTFVVADSVAMVLSLFAIGINFLATFPVNGKKAITTFVSYGYMLTTGAMMAMVIAFVEGLQAVLRRSELLKATTSFIFPVFYIFFLVPYIFIMVPKLVLIFCGDKVESYKNIGHFTHVPSLMYCLRFYYRVSYYIKKIG